MYFACGKEKLRHYINYCEEYIHQAKENDFLEKHRKKKKAAKKIRLDDSFDKESGALIRAPLAGKASSDTRSDSGSDVDLFPSDLMASLVLEGAYIKVAQF